MTAFRNTQRRSTHLSVTYSLWSYLVDGCACQVEARAQTQGSQLPMFLLEPREERLIRHIAACAHVEGLKQRTELKEK